MTPGHASAVSNPHPPIHLRLTTGKATPMSLRLIVSQPSDAVIAEAEAAERARIITAYVTAKASGNRAGIRGALYAVMDYDAANPDAEPLMDEIDGLHLPAAA